MPFGGEFHNKYCTRKYNFKNYRYYVQITFIQIQKFYFLICASGFNFHSVENKLVNIAIFDLYNFQFMFLNIESVNDRSFN